MDQQMLLVIMAVFTGIAAIALTIQAFFLFGMFKAAKAVQANVDRLTPKVEALMPQVHSLIPKVEAMIPKVEAVIPKIEAVLESSRATIDESRARITEITGKASEILDTTRKQMARVDELMMDASVRTKRQLEHAELIVDDAIARTQQTVTMVHSGVMRPLREITGVAAGMKAALQFLMKGVRPSPDRLTVDEEMFI